MFLVSNIKINCREKWNDSYIEYDSNVYLKKTKDYLFIFEGYLYPDYKLKNEEIICFFINHCEDNKFPKNFKRFKGKFSGVFINHRENSFILFNDQLGLCDLFYYKNGNGIIISNNFFKILSNIEIKEQDVDNVAIYEFILFNYPLLDRTFIKKIELLPLASIYKIKNDKLNKFSYWKYKFEENISFSEQKILSDLYTLFNKSMSRIKKISGKGVVYGLGLSGGLDSRLVAYYAKEYKMPLKTFTFGEKNSDACFIARKVAKYLKLEHTKIGYSKNFIRFSKKSMQFNPMMNLMYSWYYSGYKCLPNFDVLLTGFYGGEMFGSHIMKSDLRIKNQNQLIKVIFNRFNQNNIKIPIENQILIFNDLKKFIINSPNINPIDIIQEFDFKQRQLKFIKNNPGLNFLGMFKSFSIFTDIDLIEYSLQIPTSLKLEKKIYKDFFKTYLKGLSKIREEQGLKIYEIFLTKFLRKGIRLIDNILKTNLFYKKSHKRLDEWLKENGLFYRYCQEIICSNKKNPNFLGLINLKNELKSIYRGTSENIDLFFKLLTVLLFRSLFFNETNEFERKY